MSTGWQARAAGNGRIRSLVVAFAVTAALFVTLLVPAWPAAAEPTEGTGRPDVVEPGSPVEGGTVKVKASPIKEPVAPKAAELDLPSGGGRTIPVVARSSDADAALDELVDVGGLPVGITRGETAGPEKVAIEVVAPEDGTGAQSPVLALRPVAGAAKAERASTQSKQPPASVDVSIDYSGFARQFGGAYGNRLTVVELPACAATTPGKAACTTGTPVETVNRTADDVLVAKDVVLKSSDEPVMLAVMADVAGETGTFGASNLSPSSTWSTDQRSGSFAWSYPISTPDVPGSFTPTVGLSYSSGGIDGRTSSTNNQGSQVGDGFDLWPGYIERKYKPCALDEVKNDSGNAIGDLCWDYDNAFISFNGAAGELVPDGTNKWRLQKDDGTKIELLKNTALANGDADGEYWKVTTPTGAQYFFGRHKLPGWATGDQTTNSAWTVPVVGDNVGEPCRGATRAESWCQQGWRWNLDLAIDATGNAVSYYYTQETNRYGRLGSAALDTPYVRGGYLNRIEYGLDDADLYAGDALARVNFTNSERCLSDGSGQCDSIATLPNGWHDVPWDLNCNSGATCDQGRTSPSFWTRKRLTGITTQVSIAGAWKTVDSWQLTHKWGTADSDYQLLLASVRRTGHTGHVGDADLASNVSLPAVSFDYDQLVNRLDRTGDGQAPFVKERLSTVVDETGGQIDVGYSAPACNTSNLPAENNNTTRCFPQMRSQGDVLPPVTDWFNKYVVTAVVTTDRTGGAPDSQTQYEYLGGGAWHWDESTGMTPVEEKTWSDWRGYGQVRTTTGSVTQRLTQSDSWFLRGMHGDRANRSGGTKTVTVELGTGEGDPITDSPKHQGFAYKTATYTGPDGSVLSKEVKRPWWHQTAVSQRDWGTIRSGYLNTAKSTTWTSLAAGGGSPWRTTEQVMSYNETYGQVTQIEDRGNVDVASDDRCVKTTYLNNTTKNILGMHDRKQTWAVGCGASPNRAGGDIINDVRYAYDGQGYGVAPTAGRVTRTADLAGYDSTVAKYVEQASTYDTHGRPLTVTELSANVRVAADGTLTRTTRSDSRTTTTAYTPATGFATSMVETTPPAVAGQPTTALTTTTTLDPVRGLPTKVTDTNTKSTYVRYDALGRVGKVWLADRATTQEPSARYTYRVVANQPVAVATTVPDDNGGVKSSWTIYDGLLRERQTQSPGPDNPDGGAGRIISENEYDARGLVWRTFDPYYSVGAPGPGLFDPYPTSVVEAQTRTEYDGVGRPVLSKLMRNDGDGGEVLATTRTSYTGDRTTVIPPVGGTPTTTVTDARGRTTQLRQHHSRTIDNANAATYDLTRYTYTGRDELATVTDPAGNQWEYTYDQRGRQIEATDPDAGTTRSTFDDRGLQTTSTNAANETLAYVYDGLGRKTELRSGSVTGTLRASWKYDTVSGAKGYLASSTRHEGTKQYTNQIVAYDKLYRPLRTAVTIPAEEGKLAGTYQTSTTYTPAGNIQGMGWSAAGSLPGQSVSYIYDDKTGWLESTAGPNGLGSELTYDTVGRVLQTEMAANLGKPLWATNTYDAATGRLDTYRVDRLDQLGVDRHETYEYDEAGNVLSLADVSRTGTDVQCFDYDYLARLVEAWSQKTTGAACAATGQDAADAGLVGGPAQYWHEYTYDKAGSRIDEVLHTAPGQRLTTRTYAYDPAQPHTATSVNQVQPAAGSLPRVESVEQYAYDAVGRTTARRTGADNQTLTWTPESRVASLQDADGSGSQYLYDADGNRLISRNTSANGTVESTLYLGHTEITVSSAQPTVAKATRYFDVGGGHMSVQDDAAQHTFVLTDHHGTGQLSVRAADLSITQRRTTPFGADRGTAPVDWAGSRGYVGGYDDRQATGLVSLGAREYDPALGRFISLDPIMDLSDPQQIHGYSYANNNPATLSDPTGLKPDDCLHITCRSTPGGGWEVTNPTNPHVDNDYLDGDPSDDCYYGCGGGSISGSGGSSASGTGTTGAAADGPTADQIAKAREVLNKSVTDVALELGWEALKEFVGWNDLMGCLNADIGGCAMLAIGIVPIGKGLKAVKAIYKIIDGVIDLTKKISWARGVISRTSRATDTVVMGRNMDDRVIPYAEKHGYGYYTGTPKFVPRSLDRVAPNTIKRIDMWYNKRWINKQTRDGKRIVDIGEPEGYRPSDFYDMERKQVRGYENYVQDLQP